MNLRNREHLRHRLTCEECKVESNGECIMVTYRKPKKT